MHCRDLSELNCLDDHHALVLLGSTDGDKRSLDKNAFSHKAKDFIMIYEGFCASDKTKNFN